MSWLSSIGIDLCRPRSNFGTPTPTPTPTLGTLTLSGTLTNGTASSGTIIGTTTGSAVVSNVTGLSVVSGTYSWDGTGAAGTTANGLVETLSGATGSPKNSSITVAAAAGAITAPVITQTSTATTNPFLWTTAENATFYEGYYWNVQTATGANTSAASTNLLAGTTNADVIQQITASDLSSTDPITFTGLTTTSTTGAIALWERVGSEDGLGGYNWGSWSNVLTDTIAASVTPVALVSTTGTGKSQYVSVSGLTLTVTGNIGALSMARADTVVTGKRHFEMTIGANSTASNNWTVGVTDTALALGPSTFKRPGNGSDQGCSVTLGHGGTTAALHANGGFVNDYPLIGAAAAGDLVVVEFDTATNVVSFWHSRSGTHLLIATVTLTSNIPTNWVGVCGGYDNVGAFDTMTMNFAGSFAKTASSGYIPYG